jgi:signal transduction histidine kinase
MRIALDNALRFSPPGEHVAVEVARMPEGSAIRVRDHGPGIPPAEREVVFERFRRGADTGGDGGFGLGLAIGRELARRMDGDLSLQDADRGTCLELRLPVAPAP